MLIDDNSLMATYALPVTWGDKPFAKLLVD